MLNLFRKWIRGNEANTQPINAPSINSVPASGVLIASTDPNFDTNDMDPMMTAALNRCLETGKIVIANRKDGGFTMEDVD